MISIHIHSCVGFVMNPLVQRFVLFTIMKNLVGSGVFSDFVFVLNRN